MLAPVLPHLRCPVCDQPLSSDQPDRRVGCPAGHTFDVARHGYAPLLRGPVRHPGDTAAMVAARERFLATGAYGFLAEALAAAAPAAAAPAAAAPAAAAPGEAGLVVEVGAGTGYYLTQVLRARPEAVGLAVDTSKPALRRAARAHPRLGAVLADAWQRLPIADHAASVVLNVFAPRNGVELARVLGGAGRLLVVTPTDDHLHELAGRLGGAAGVRLLRVAPEKPSRVAASLAPWFHRAGERVLTRRLALHRDQVRDLVLMGPSAAHTDPEALTRVVAALPEPVPVTAAVRLTSYTPVTQ